MDARPDCTRHLLWTFSKRLSTGFSNSKDNVLSRTFFQFFHELYFIQIFNSSSGHSAFYQPWVKTYLRISNGNKNRLLYNCSIQVMFIWPSPKETIKFKLQEIFGHLHKFEYFTMRWGIPKTAVTFLCSRKLSVILSQYFAIVFNGKLTSFISSDDIAKFSIQLAFVERWTIGFRSNSVQPYKVTSSFSRSFVSNPIKTWYVLATNISSFQIWQIMEHSFLT